MIHADGNEFFCKTLQESLISGTCNRPNKNIVVSRYFLPNKNIETISGFYSKMFFCLVFGTFELI